MKVFISLKPYNFNMDQHRETFKIFAEKIADYDTVKEIKLFGSVARGEHGINSDVDVLVIVSNYREREKIEKSALETTSKMGVPVTPVIVEKDAEKTNFLETVNEEGISYVRS